MPLGSKLQDKTEHEKVTVSFNINIKNIEQEKVDQLKLEVNYCLLQLAKKFAPDDVLINLIWY